MKKKDKLLLVFLGFLVVVAFVGGELWDKHTNFSTEKWVNYEGNSRQAILKNFLDKTIIDGLSKEELIDYLGEPDSQKEEEMVYYLGTPKGLFRDKDGEEEFLVIAFKDGKASGVTVVPTSAMASE